MFDLKLVISLWGKPLDFATCDLTLVAVPPVQIVLAEPHYFN